MVQEIMGRRFGRRNCTNNFQVGPGKHGRFSIGQGELVKRLMSGLRWHKADGEK